jgi:hypothetical protein
MSMLVMLLGGAPAGSILQPSILSPGASSITNNRTPTLVGSDFSSTPGISHLSTDWQVASDSAFSNIVYQSLGNTTNKTSIVTGDLGSGVRYARIRYKGDNDIYSAYSPTIEFISPFASGSSVIQNSSSTAVVTATTTATLLAGTYRITLWGGGGGGSPRSQQGGGAGAVRKTVTYGSTTNVSFTIGQGGGAATGSADSNTNVGGSGGSPGGAAGLNVGTNYWNGGGGGGYSSAISMTAAGGGGAGGDYSAPGGAGGNGTAAGGSRFASISSSTNRSGGFSIEGSYASNLNIDTGCSRSFNYTANVSFSNMQGQKIDVKLVATGPGGTFTDERLNVDSSASLSVSSQSNCNLLQVYYKWSSGYSGTSGISHNLTASWNGEGSVQTASSGTSGGGGGGGSNAINGPGSTGGQGGDNTGTVDAEANGSGINPGFAYSYAGYTYGLGGSDSNPGNNGAALIEKL